MPIIAQRRIKVESLIEFLKGGIQPLSDNIYGNRYRAAVRLVDDTYLPCVVFQSRRSNVELALRRFNELRDQPSQYRTVVESFVSNGSHIAEYEIQSVESSPFAWPISILREIRGETVMGWTAFVVEMMDGAMHSFGTSFHTEFFDLPRGYAYSNITRIHSGMIYSAEQGLVRFSLDSSSRPEVYREKPFFTCYVDGV
jgi:hypothetical protein